MRGLVYVVTGPTATGKTELGVRLARAVSGEVVSADSMQVYRYMDIGTAKPTAEEMGGVPHHIIDCVLPTESYSAARFVSEAAACCDGLLERGITPVIVGGTGLYIDSLISGRDFAPGGDMKTREKYSAMYDRLGGEAMLEMLRERDPERAGRLHPNDRKRVVRALEVTEHGGTISEHDRQTRARPPRYEARIIVLNYEERAELYRRIDGRVDRMMERGLVEEVRMLMRMGVPRSATAMQAIGYKELAAAIDGETTVEEAVEKVKRESRRYAKRQISWCGRYEDALRIYWGDAPDFDKAVPVSTHFAQCGVYDKAAGINLHMKRDTASGKDGST